MGGIVAPERSLFARYVLLLWHVAGDGDHSPRELHLGVGGWVVCGWLSTNAGTTLAHKAASPWLTELDYDIDNNIARLCYDNA